MKFSTTITIFAYCFALSTTNAFSDYFLKDTLPECNDDKLSLNFSNAVIIDIGTNFIKSPLINCLNLQNNHIENIELGAFSKLPNLTNLYLSYNNISNSRRLFSFGSHDKLKVLMLDKAARTSTTISIQLAGKYPNLEMLSVQENGFSDMSPVDMFDDIFPKLKYLDLSGNKMKGNLFVNLLPTGLTTLHLQDNAFVSLSLAKLSEMTTLTLNNNNISYMRKHATNGGGLLLEGLKNLRHLSISKNKVHFIEKTAFQDTTNLNFLNLSRNNLNFVYLETFSNLQALKTLDLSSNQLTVVPTLRYATNISTLSLTCNKIMEITTNAFAKTPKLTELSLKGNQISKIHADGFVNLHSLVRLDLSKNKLASLPAGWSGSFTSLKYLDLSDNQLTSLESLILAKSLPLLELYLEQNPLKSFVAHSFENLPLNVTVDLRPRSGMMLC